MQLEKQVVSLDQAKRLKELGVTAPSLFDWWYSDRHKEWHPLIKNATDGRPKSSKGTFPAYTCAELGEMLPNHKMRLRGRRDESLWFYNQVELEEKYFNGGFESSISKSWIKKIVNAAKTEAEARAALLIFLIENKIITPESISNE